MHRRDEHDLPRWGAAPLSDRTRRVRRDGGRTNPWRRRLDGSPNRSEIAALLAAPTKAAQPPPLHHALGGPKPNEGLRQAMVAKQAEETIGADGASDPLPDRWWARSTNRSASRGSKARPMPRAGRVESADAVAMLEALGTQRAARMVDRGGKWRARSQAVLAVAAGLAVMGNIEQVLGRERRRWWKNLCALSVTTVRTLDLPPVAQRAVRRWLKVRMYSALPWVAVLGSPVATRNARERLGMCAAREAWRLTGRAVRAAALLRWSGVAPDVLKHSARRRRLWAG